MHNPERNSCTYAAGCSAYHWLLSAAVVAPLAAVSQAAWHGMLGWFEAAARMQPELVHQPRGACYWAAVQPAYADMHVSSR